MERRKLLIITAQISSSCGRVLLLQMFSALLLLLLSLSHYSTTLSSALILSNRDNTASLNQVSSSRLPSSPPLSSSSLSSPQSSYEKFFYHTTNGIIPFDREITIYIISGEAKRLYYQIHKEKQDIALTVTPCGDNIEWKLLFLQDKSHNKKGQRTMRARRRYKRRHNKYIYSNSLNNAKPTLLTSYIGNDRRTYTDVSTLPGLYIIDFNSRGKDATIKLFLSQHYPYPLLPNNADVKLSSLKNDKAMVTWDMSPSETVTPIEYCVAITTRRSLINNCQLDFSSKYGNSGGDEQFELDLLPSVASSSFANWWGNTVKKMLRDSKASDIMAATVDDNYAFECIGKNTWHAFRKLNSSVNYYIDVFAKNSVTNATSMYRTLNITATMLNDEPIRLKDSEQIAIRLSTANNYTRTLKYTLSAKNNDRLLWLFVNSCTGFGPIRVIVNTIARNGSQSSDSDSHASGVSVFDMNTMEISVKPNETQAVIIELTSDTANDRNAIVLVSRKHSRFPFPRLPNDKRIRVLESLTSCDSVTLSWTASPDDKVLYCIYQSEASNHHHSVVPQQKSVCAADKSRGNYINTNYYIDNTAISNQSKAKRVLCRRYHKLSKRRRNNVIMQNVKRLSAGTKYVFQVMITKYRGRTLTYEHVWVSTKSANQCRNSSR